MLTSTVWTFYPIVVFLGRAQCHLISKNTEDCLLCLLDMSAKLDSNPNPNPQPEPQPEPQPQPDPRTPTRAAKLGMEGLIIAFAVWGAEGSDGSDGSDGSA